MHRSAAVPDWPCAGLDACNNYDLMEFTRIIEQLGMLLILATQASLRLKTQ